MTCADVAKIQEGGDLGKASVYANVFGANLLKRRTSDRPIFKAMSSFGVGDESTKANFAVLDPYAQADGSPKPGMGSGTVEYRNRLQSPQRIGWENMEGFSTANPSSGNRTRIANFSINDARLNNISTSREISLLETVNPAQIYKAAKDNFHSLTAFSRSLLTDTALGGLKKDLTDYLIDGDGLNNSTPIPDRDKYNPNDARFRAWGGSNTGFPSASASGGLPKWGQLREWYQNTSAGDSIEPTPTMAPVLSYISLHMGLSYDPPSTPDGHGTLNWHWAPIVVLWNPYDVSLSSAHYTLEVQVSPNWWRVFLAKINPSLEELQKDQNAQWDSRPVGPELPGGGRAVKHSFRGTASNPDFPSGPPDPPDPLA